VFNETSNKTHINAVGKRGGRLLRFSLPLVFALTIYLPNAHAQLIGDLKANIPFQFQAGNSKFPPGEYVLRMLGSPTGGIMEIRSMDGSTSALFEVQPVKANSAPARSELVFNKYGNRYFLAELFDEGYETGDQVVESRDEKSISRDNHAGHQRVSARHGS
jgi:hypothetical protein